MSSKIDYHLFERQAASQGSPKAYVFVPDQNWDGNDGSWSTFIVQVGTPPQYFRVLPSINGRETWVPMPSDCQQGKSWCGNARGVEPFPNPSTALTLSTLDAGLTCSANKSPMCDNCVPIEGHCTTGPCAGQYCCGGNPGSCNSAGCNGVSGICTAAYIGCNCLGDDYDVASNNLKSPGAANPATAVGFQFNQTSTWTVVGNYTLQGGNHLSNAGNGLFGTDVVAAGPNQDARLAIGKASLVAGITAQPYYLGLLGLRPSDDSRFNDSSPSFLTLLKNQNMIPSLSFGYAAGAAYREYKPFDSGTMKSRYRMAGVSFANQMTTGFQGVLGSLVLGGLDRSRAATTNVTFSITKEDSYALHAGIQSVTASNTLIGDVELVSNNITAIVDSDLPYLYLPSSACKKFETAFGLSWDASHQLYQVNDTVHGKLRTENPTISFSLGETAAKTVNISLPYQAFDLQVTQPIAENGTNYFPLRCSSNASQYVLGRAFLQETYLFVDYEESSFSLSQAQCNNNSDIVTINHSASNQPSGATPVNSGKNSLSHGAIAGIAIGSSVAVVLLISLLFFLLRRSRGQRQNHSNNRTTISAPIPVDGRKNSWPNSPTSNREGIIVPPMTASSSAQSPFQTFEERLERLERANTTTRLPEYTQFYSEFPGESATSLQGRPPIGDKAQRPKQELAGSPTARELQEARMSGRDQRSRSARYVFELAADDQKRSRGKP